MYLIMYKNKRIHHAIKTKIPYTSVVGLYQKKNINTKLIYNPSHTFLACLSMLAFQIFIIIKFLFLSCKIMRIKQGRTKSQYKACTNVLINKTDTKYYQEI